MDVHRNEAAYEVEFMRLAGRTMAVVTVLGKQLSAVDQKTYTGKRAEPTRQW